MKVRIRIAYGLCSYGVALALLLIPYFSSPETPAASRIVSFLAGGFLLAVALLTDYELGLAKLLRFRENAWLVMIGSMVVTVLTLLLCHGPLIWLIVTLTTAQFVVASTAFKVHYINRHRLA